MTSHVAAARTMPLALMALLGLVRHLELREDSAKHKTFSLTMGKRCEPALSLNRVHLKLEKCDVTYSEMGVVIIDNRKVLVIDHTFSPFHFVPFISTASASPRLLNASHIPLPSILAPHDEDELRKYMHYDAAASKAMGVFPSPNRFRLASALGHADDGRNASDFSLFSILNKTCTAMGCRRLKG